MTELNLHPTPRAGEILRENLRVLALTFRRETIVLALVFACLASVMAVSLIRGDMATWFDSSDDEFGVALVSFLFPFAVWRHEKRFGPAFLWTLPVDRRRHAVIKVFAGWVFLTTALVIYLSIFLFFAFTGGVTFAQKVSVLPFLTSTAMYLLGSALALGLRYPFRWLFGAIAISLILGNLNNALERTVYSTDPFLYAVARRLTHAWNLAPRLAWAITSFVWLGAGLAALWFALLRHRELRRR